MTDAKGDLSMKYDYYCTECGRKLNHETILFDMDALLTQSKDEGLNLIHLRMTEQELLSLINSGRPVADDYYECAMSFQQLMEYLSGPNSMNLAELKELTLEEVNQFLQQGSSLYDLLGAGRSDGFGAGIPGRTAANRREAYPLAIRKLLSSSERNIDPVSEESNLRKELSMIRALFQTTDGQYHFLIKPHEEMYGAGADEKVMDGYLLNMGDPLDNARICPKCKKRLFEKAGTAEHRVISFIGKSATGKTSIILALTHYALYGLCENGDTDGRKAAVWKQKGVIAEGRRREGITCRLLNDDNAKLKSDLEWFTYGVAPKKTEAGEREDAYHATLRISNHNDGRQMIVSLMDLPGELFSGHKVNEGKLQKEFSAALSSSAFVICFDTESGGMSSAIEELVDISRGMQQLRMGKLHEKYYVPSMLLFSKYDDAVEPLKAEDGRATDLYMLQSEAKDLSENRIYKLAMQRFRKDPLLFQSYFAAMRCGAFGHEVPNTQEVGGQPIGGDLPTGFDPVPSDTAPQAETKEEQVAAYAKAHSRAPETMIPKPNQIDLLMQWMLQITGCLPCEATYATKAAHEELKNFYLGSPQYRQKNPGDGNRRDDYDLHEAMARCLMFSNPGHWDTKLVESLNVSRKNNWPSNWFALESIVWTRKRMKWHDDSNASERGRR